MKARKSKMKRSNKLMNALIRLLENFTSVPSSINEKDFS